jgi:hypothetical protein
MGLSAQYFLKSCGSVFNVAAQGRRRGGAITLDQRGEDRAVR